MQDTPNNDIIIRELAEVVENNIQKVGRAVNSETALFSARAAIESLNQEETGTPTNKITPGIGLSDLRYENGELDSLDFVQIEMYLEQEIEDYFQKTYDGKRTSNFNEDSVSQISTVGDLAIFVYNQLEPDRDLESE